MKEEKGPRLGHPESESEADDEANEQDELAEERDKLEETLGSAAKMKKLIAKELKEDADNFGDDRRSPLVERNDAKATEAETIRSEENAQKAYEDFVKDTNASIEAKSKDIVNKSETKAQTEADLVTTKESKEATMLEAWTTSEATPMDLSRG